jgi:hypothetical protein
MAIKYSTAKFTALLTAAAEWDKRFPELHEAQKEWLLSNHAFGDGFVIFASLEDRQRWDVPQVIQGHLFTICRWRHTP